MSHKVFLDKEDFDVYYFDFPKHKKWQVFTKKKMYVYVLKELEKSHPFFGSHCDVDIRKVCKNKKICIRVIVLDTLVLTRYSNKKRSLHIYDEKNHAIRVFELNKTKSKRYFFCIIGLLCVLIALLYFLMKTSSTKEQSEPAVITEKKTIECFCIFSHLSSILTENVYCNSLRYRSVETVENSRSITIHIALTGLYPEDIVKINANHEPCTLCNHISLSPVSFRENVPSVELLFSQMQSTKKHVSNNFDLSVIRNHILEYEGDIQEEDSNLMSIFFSIRIESWTEYYEELFLMLQKTNTSFSSLELFYDELSKEINVYCSFTSGCMEDDFIEIKDIFSNQKALVAEKPLRITSHREESKPINTHKVGLITKADGSVIVFHTDTNGKMFYKEEE